MPITTAVSIGPQNLLLQNQVYAMPGKGTRGYTDVAVLEGSNLPAGTFAAITVLAGEFQTAAPFIRCTTGDANVRLVAL